MFKDLHRVRLPGSGRWLALAVVLTALAVFPLAGCGSGSGTDGANGTNGLDGQDGQDGAQGPPGSDGSDATTKIDVTTADWEDLEALTPDYEILGVAVASPPVVTFRIMTDTGLPIVGLESWLTDYDRFFRFTLAKLVPGFVDGAEFAVPDSWVSYIRSSSSGNPSYDSLRSGGSLVGNGDGTYVYTFGTDVTALDDITWEPGLTHRLGGQMGGGGFPIRPLNFAWDFVPSGAGVSLRRNIATTASCNECHDGLTIHGRRYLVEYCVTCHNPDVADGEGNMSYMIHRIHNAMKFDVLHDAQDFSEVTYPQDVTNCRKCHTADDAATPQGDNWKTLPNRAACDACHDVYKNDTHPFGSTFQDGSCQFCHSADQIEEVHGTANSTPNNPQLPAGQRAIAYDLIDASVDPTTGHVTVHFNIESDGSPLDLLDLPEDLLDGARWPGFLLAWSLAPLGGTAPADFTNDLQTAAQPIGVAIDDLDPISAAPLGTLTWDAVEGHFEAVFTDPSAIFPPGAEMRTVGLQGYFRQDLDGDHAYDASLHAVSAVVTVEDDDARREIVDSEKCANCHEWFEGHGGNRVKEIAICTMCHVPNLSSSGRIADLTVPEDAQNLRDMIHGIHSSGFRTRAYEHVRNFRGSNSVYDWSEVTFPAHEGTKNCLLCHKEGTYGLPVTSGLLPTTVRTTSVDNGLDALFADVVAARASVPNPTDWVTSPTAGTCSYCHTSSEALGHMLQNGAVLSLPTGLAGSTVVRTNRDDFDASFEACDVCHGAGKVADVATLHVK